HRSESLFARGIPRIFCSGRLEDVAQADGESGTALRVRSAADRTAEPVQLLGFEREVAHLRVRVRPERRGEVRRRQDSLAVRYQSQQLWSAPECVCKTQNDKTAIRAGAGRFFLLSRATVSGHTGAAFNTDSGVPWSL